MKYGSIVDSRSFWPEMDEIRQSKGDAGDGSRACCSSFARKKNEKKKKKKWIQIF